MFVSFSRPADHTGPHSASTARRTPPADDASDAAAGDDRKEDSNEARDGKDDGRSTTLSSGAAEERHSCSRALLPPRSHVNTRPASAERGMAEIVRSC